MTNRIIHVVVLAIASVACASNSEGSNDEKASTGTVAAAARSSAASGRGSIDRNACELLTLAEVGAAVGSPVTATETNHEPGRSDCYWTTADSMAGMGLVAYWTGGKEGWQILAASRGMAKDIVQQQEGVALDSIVKAGPVEGIGDRALFSPLLPSLVLQGNVLLELTLSPLPDPAAHFRRLATKAVSRL